MTICFWVLKRPFSLNVLITQDRNNVIIQYSITDNLNSTKSLAPSTLIDPLVLACTHACTHVHICDIMVHETDKCQSH